MLHDQSTSFSLPPQTLLSKSVTNLLLNPWGGHCPPYYQPPYVLHTEQGEAEIQPLRANPEEDKDLVLESEHTEYTLLNTGSG